MNFIIIKFNDFNGIYNYGFSLIVAKLCCQWLNVNESSSHINDLDLILHNLV